MVAATLQLLPSGLVVPPLPYLAGLAVAAVLVGAALYSVEPAVTDDTVVAFTPWMVTGAGLHALAQLDAAPAAIAPLTTAPAVYVTTTVLAGAVWAVAATSPAAADRPLLLAGVPPALVVSGAVLQVGLARGAFDPTIPVVGLALSAVLAVATYRGLGRVYPAAVDAVGAAGPVVVFGHALDGVSTALGVDLLGVGERSPLPRAILGVAESLPTAQFIGSGWLFVVVKLGIGAGVLVLFADFVEEDPRPANALLGVIAAVGFGPGTHNLLLFTVAGA